MSTNIKSNRLRLHSLNVVLKIWVESVDNYYVDNNNITDFIKGIFLHFFYISTINFSVCYTGLHFTVAKTALILHLFTFL